MAIQNLYVLHRSLYVGEQLDEAAGVRGYVDVDGDPQVEIGGQGSGWHVIMAADVAADLGDRLMRAAALTKEEAARKERGEG